MYLILKFIILFRLGWNKDVTTNVGIPLVEGITHFMDGEYTEAVEKMAPIMPELQKKIQVCEIAIN